MEAKPQVEQSSQPQTETPQPDTAAPATVPPANSIADVIMAAMDKIEKEGCGCGRPECAARSMHKLDTALPEEFKPHWQIVKEGIDKQFSVVSKETNKLRKLAQELDSKVMLERKTANELREQLATANRANLKLIKTVGRLSKK